MLRERPEKWKKDKKKKKTGSHLSASEYEVSPKSGPKEGGGEWEF